MEHAQIYADVAASGAKDYNSRDHWHVLDQQLAHGDVLVVAAVDRLGRRYLETAWATYNLHRRGVRLRPLPATKGNGILASLIATVVGREGLILLEKILCPSRASKLPLSPYRRCNTRVCVN